MSSQPASSSSKVRHIGLSAKMDNQWSRMRAIIRSEVGESAYDQWIKILTLDSCEDGCVSILAPNASISAWVRQNYRLRIQQLWRDFNADVREVLIISAGELDSPARSSSADDDSLYLSPPASERPNPVWLFANFIMDESNRVACSVARALPEDQSLCHSPLYIYGGVGLGKTHLLHALANHLEQEHRSLRYLLLTGEKFSQGFVQAIRERSIESFKSRCRSVDVLLIDDVHFFNGREKMQDELMHTLDALQRLNKRIAITSNGPPSSLDGVSERVRSLFSGGLVCEVSSPSLLLRKEIVSQRVSAQSVAIPAEVLDFVAREVSESIRALDGALNRIFIHARMREGMLTLDLARELLSDLFDRKQKRITIEDIQRKVAEHYCLKQSELNSERRSREIARPRQVAMYLAKHLTNRSMPEIGRKFGGRDHTTVIHAINRVKILQREDEALTRDVEILRCLLEG